MGKVREETATNDGSKAGILELLEEEQDISGYLSPEFISQTAKSLGISVSEVYGVATFYSFLCTRPLGRNVIRLCKSLPCFLKNSNLVIDSINKELGIKPGETTADGRFSFELTNCIGACDKAPAMIVNHDVHGNLTPEKISQVLEGYP
jgi:NADH-quinone oxidoreductase E subunit